MKMARKKLRALTLPPAPYVVLIPAEHILADRGGIVAQML